MDALVPTPLAPEQEPPVSIVVPVYNGEAFLAQALESALAQTYRRFELVVADNRSTDRSADIAEEYAARDSRVRVERAEAHLAIRANWNRALGLISPDSRYVKVLSADDMLLPGCLAGQVAVAEAHPAITLVGGYRFDADRLGCLGLPLNVSVAPGHGIVRRALLGGSDLFGAPPNVLYRADRVRARPEFYSLPFFNFDDGACVEVLEAGDFGFVHQVVSWSRGHPGQETSTVNRLREWESGDLVLLARYGRRFLSPGELRRRLVAAGGGYSWMLAKQTVKGRPWADPGFRGYHAEALARIADELSAGGRRGDAALARTIGRALARAGADGAGGSPWVFA